MPVSGAAVSQQNGLGQVPADLPKNAKVKNGASTVPLTFWITQEEALIWDLPNLLKEVKLDFFDSCNQKHPNWPIPQLSSLLESWLLLTMRV